MQRLEFLTEIPSIFAIHRNRNAFVLDLQDNKFEITDKNKNWYTVDALIKNKVRILRSFSLCGTDLPLKSVGQ